MPLLSSAGVFQNKLFKRKTLSGTLSGCQAVWIKIRTDILSDSVLIWVQTVCKDYQQTKNLADDRGETIKWSAC